MNNLPNRLGTLQQSIQMAEQALRRRHANQGKGEDADSGSTGYIFTGNIQHTAPHNLLFDSILSPTDKAVWMVMRAGIHNPQMPGSVPSRQQLADSVNCSPPTITNSRTMLRICRWMTFSHQVRDENNRFIGDVYLLHDEPLGIAETLEIDPGFVAFLESIQSNSSSNKATRDQAAKVYRDIVAIDVDPTPISQLQAISNRIKTATRLPSWDGDASASAVDLAQVRSQPFDRQSHGKIFNTAQPEYGPKFTQPETMATPHADHSKNFYTDNGGQRKNFNLESQRQNSIVDTPHMSHGKNLSMEAPSRVQINTASESNDTWRAEQKNLPPKQVKNIFPSICSTSTGSMGSSSSINNLSATDFAFAENPFGLNRMGGVARSFEHLKTEGLIEKTDVNEDIVRLQLDLLLTVERVLRQSLPALISERLKPHYDVLVPYLKVLPIVGTLLQTLPDITAQEIAWQLFARLLFAEHPIAHCRTERIKNLVGFTKELVKRAKEEDFNLDDHGLIIQEAVVSNISLVGFQEKQLVKGVKVPKLLPLEL